MRLKTELSLKVRTEHLLMLEMYKMQSFKGRNTRLIPFISCSERGGSSFFASSSLFDSESPEAVSEEGCIGAEG